LGRANRLVELRVSFGDHVRSVVAGLEFERPDPQEIVGRQFLFVVTLAASASGFAA
jgi:tRNA-binding protein